MSPHTVFDNFGQFADAPNGVAKLRELILQLAVQGKLLAQHTDEPAGNDLLRKLLKDGSKAKLNGFAETDLDVHSWVIPKSWAFTHLESASYEKGIFADGDWVETKDQDPSGEIRLIQLADVGDGKYRDRSSRFMNEETAIRLNCTFLATNDVLIARMPDPIARACIFPGDAKKSVTVVDVCILRANTDYFIPEFLVIAINSPVFRKLIESKITGTTRSRISRGNLAGLPIPILALEEQKRIVARVNDLMRLCDELGARQQAKRESRVRLNNVTLAPLNSATSLAPEVFEQAAARLAENFATLYDSTETVGRLRSTILQLAVQGKLVPQNPNDEPASVLLERIKDEHKQLIKDGKLKKLIGLPAVDPNYAPFELPLGWAWARFPELGEFSRGRSKHRPRNAPELYTGGTYKFVQTGDVARANGTITTFTALYNEEGLAQSRMWPAGTMCITIAANIADSGILGFDACFPDSVVGFVPSPIIGNAEYFEYFMRTAKSHLTDFAPSTAQKNINVGILQEVLIPLPPLEEQKRIVSKVNQLMALCDELETKLRQAEADSEILMKAAVQHVLDTVGGSPKPQLTSMTA